MSSSVLKERLSGYFELSPIKTHGLVGNGPAEYYRIKGTCGLVDFISPLSNHFCQQCNRIRLTPDGKLRLCLGEQNEVDIKTPLRDGYPDEGIKQLIISSIQAKPQSHQFHKQKLTGRQMSAIGG